MANDSLSSIRAGLTTFLGTVTEIKEVKASRTTDFNQFPCARHYFVGIGDELLDTANNYRTYRFGIDIMMPYSIQGMTKETAEALFQDAIDAVVDKLNTNWAMNVDHSIVEIGTVQQIEDWPSGPAVVLSIVWQARTAITF